MSTWTGAAQTGDWGEKKNWGGGVPDEGSDVVIPRGMPFGGPLCPGAKVKSVRIEGGELSGSITITERFAWAGGSLPGTTVKLGSASLTIERAAEKSAFGVELAANSITVIDAHDVKLGGAAMILVKRELTSTGESRLTWTGGANPMLLTRPASRITVQGGKLVIDDVIGWFASLVTVVPGAVLQIESQTVPSYLHNATVTGGGRLSVGGGGRLYAGGTARIDTGTTLELGPDGSIEDQRGATLYANILKEVAKKVGGASAVATKQLLTVDGQLLWTGGAIYGNVVLGQHGALTAGGTLCQHVLGRLTLNGSGVIAGPGQFVVDIATLAVGKTGDLLLQSGLALSDGRNYTIENEGNLRVSGGGVVTLGRNRLVNRGTIEVLDGALELTGLYEQLPVKGRRPGGASPAPRLSVLQGATLRMTNDLTIDHGALVGAGTVILDSAQAGLLVGHGKARAELGLGVAPKPGRLSIAGSVRLGPRALLRARVEGTTPGDQHSQLLVSGAVEIGGELTVEALPGYASQPGDVLEVVRAGAADGVQGRFRKATLPKPAGGRFLRVHYAAQALQLVSSTNYIGLDANVYPGDDAMREHAKAHPREATSKWSPLGGSPYRWVGYYLHTHPYHTNASWLGKRNFLSHELKLGVAILYVGRQRKAHGLSAHTGRVDAQDAVTKTVTEGFDPGSWIYLDVEWTKAGISDEKVTYAEAWVTELLRLGSYRPAVYCPVQDVARLSPRLATAFRAAGRDDRVRFWVAADSRPFDPALPPAASTVPEAIAWQQYFPEPAPIDFNVSVLADPSAP